MKSQLIYNISTDDNIIEEYCSNLFRNGISDDAREIYRGRNTLYETTCSNGRRLCIKHFQKAKFPNSYIYTTFRHSKARRSFDNADLLLSRGFLTPRPIAWSEQRKVLKLCESYYICEYLNLPNVRDWGKQPDSDALIEAMGAYLLSLHKAGIYHRDFSPGNILVDRLEGGKYRFYLVDINRMRFNVTNRKTLMSMFRSISLDPEETRRLAIAYASASGEDSDIIVAEALNSLKKYLATKRRHRRWKRLIGKK